MTTILWYRQDLRVDDHPALHAAVKRGGPLVPVYIWSPEEEGEWAPGGASRWWLHHSLTALDASLRKRGSRLTILQGPTEQALRQVLDQTDASAVCWSRRFEPAAAEIDAGAQQLLEDRGIESQVFNSSLLHDPGEVQTKTGGPYQVFTPFWKSLQESLDIGKPIAPPSKLPSPKSWPKSISIDELELLPAVDWAGEIAETWKPGEKGAHEQLGRFLASVSAYDGDRDRPDREGTSRLSPHLHFGEISPRRVWHEVIEHEAEHRQHGLSKGAASFLREVGWREFGYHLLHHFPHTPEKPLREQYAKFPWRRSKKDLKAWERGQTGYPYVDAGMRQLWATGWMHNRVRMMVASFLVKHLLLDWRHGAKWFWDTLVDADLANNTLGWQWTAGCGADAAPYFRIFNPITQGQKFDPEGDYVRRWVPELKEVPTKFIHQPWEAPGPVLREAGVKLGETYPHPIVEHSAARERALEALAAIKDDS